MWRWVNGAFLGIWSSNSYCRSNRIGYLVYKLQKHEEQKDKAEEIRRKKTPETESQRQNEYNALRASLLALTRDRILQGYRYFKRKGTVSAQDLCCLSCFRWQRYNYCHL